VWGDHVKAIGVIQIAMQRYSWLAIRWPPLLARNGEITNIQR